MPKVRALRAADLLDNLRARYLGSGAFQELLAREKIEVLSEFLDNWDRIKEFYTRYYGDRFPSNVLCGLNPGRLGAGKTGIPFLDFASLSKLLPGIRRRDTERSAQFFIRVVEHFGAENFFRSFYVTNVSWVGYKRGRKNLNYPELPSAALAFVQEAFRWEMGQIKPNRIISLSAAVQTTVAGLFLANQIDVSLQLRHPNYCAFPTKMSQCLCDYIALLNHYCAE
jgi:hypothetical protein